MVRLTKQDYDKLFCKYGAQYNIKKLLLKAVAICESALDERKYEYDHNFWLKHLKDIPKWKDKEPTEVSAKYGLMKIFYPTAASLGFSGTPEDLYKPVYNIALGTMLLRRHANKVEKDRLYEGTSLWPIEIVLARFRGGSHLNPDAEGNLRNIKYVKKVMRTYGKLLQQEKECDE